MDLVIRLPVSYPLRPVDVNCTKSIGISDAKQRKWLMSMQMFVRNQVLYFNVNDIQFHHVDHIWLILFSPSKPIST